MPRQLGSRVVTPPVETVPAAGDDRLGNEPEELPRGSPIGSPPNELSSVRVEALSLSPEPTANLSDIVCPICNQSMLTLAQLNQHLDDEHMELIEPATAKSEGWLGLLLKDGLSKLDQAGVKPTAQPVQRITRKHWQKPSLGLQCHHASCKRPVDREGVNCRQCGFIYCKEHGSYRRKLDQHAKPNINGIWARVCVDCFNQSSWWGDRSASVKDRTSELKMIRQKHIDVQALVVDRLEKRMAKLVSGLAQIDKESDGLFTFKDSQRKRQVEHDIVAWEDEKPIERCRLCGQKFSYFTRKHHCRSCGRVVCGDMDRECSREVGISLLAEKLDRPNLATNSTYPVRICQECRSTVFGHRNFVQEINAQAPRFLQLHSHLKYKRDQIDALLPRFQEFVGRLSEGDADPGVIAETKAVRTQLLANFSQFDAISRRIKDEQTSTDTEEWIKQRIILWATEYLQQTMLPLQALPQIFQKDETPRLRKDEESTLQNKLVVLEEQKFMLEKMVMEAKQKRKFDELAPLQGSLDELERETNGLRQQLGTLAPQ